LFIHIPKNAGKSVEQAVGLVPEQDLVDYQWRSTLNRLSTALQRMTRDKATRSRLWGILDYTLIAQHLTYSEIELLRLINEQALRSLVSFAVCRNPYDRAVSIYFHLAASDVDRTPANFQTWLRQWLDAEPTTHSEVSFRRPQWMYCTDLRGQVVLDHLLKFESLAEDFESLCLELGIEHTQLPWIGKRRDRASYAEFYDGAARRAVEQAYAEDFERFEYRFETG
jgi:hypothetical protein